MSDKALALRDRHSRRRCLTPNFVKNAFMRYVLNASQHLNTSRRAELDF
jgi:hypothetical protein